MTFTEKYAAYMTMCGACYAGVTGCSCICPRRDPREVIAELCALLDSVAALVE